MAHDGSFSPTDAVHAPERAGCRWTASTPLGSTTVVWSMLTASPLLTHGTVHLQVTLRPKPRRQQHSRHPKHSLSIPQRNPSARTWVPQGCTINHPTDQRLNEEVVRIVQFNLVFAFEVNKVSWIVSNFKYLNSY